jgi:hypothetical protein
MFEKAVWLVDSPRKSIERANLRGKTATAENADRRLEQTLHSRRRTDEPVGKLSRLVSHACKVNNVNKLRDGVDGNGRSR